MGWQIHQLDVKTTFLNRVIEEEMYIEQLEGFETHERRTHVCRLKKALYGLKQVARAWYGRIKNCLRQMGSVKSDKGPNLYYLMLEGEQLILVLYVNGLFLIGSSRLIEDYKRNLAVEFIMKDLVLMHYFLGLSKHIDIRCHFIRDCVQRGAVHLQYVPTEEQVADILTKALGRAKFIYFRESMGMAENTFQ
eukprot:PITA_25210